MSELWCGRVHVADLINMREPSQQLLMIHLMGTTPSTHAMQETEHYSKCKETAALAYCLGPHHFSGA